MKPRLLLLFAFTLSLSALAQRPLRDSFEVQVLSTVDRLLTKAMDPGTRPEDLAGELIRVTATGVPVYRPLILLPLGTEHEYSRLTNIWSRNTVRWTWTCWIRYTSKSHAESARRKLDSLLRRQEGAWKKLARSDRQFFFDHGIRSSDTLHRIFLDITLDLPIGRNENAVADSIFQRYRPYLNSRNTVAEYTEKLSKALYAEGISKEMITAKAAPLVPELAAKDIQLAYAFLLIDGADPQQLVNGLSSTQREEIRAMAQKDVDAYYARNRPKPSDEERLAAYQKEQEQVKAEQQPRTPCEQAIQAAPFREGVYFTTGAQYGRIMSYDCTAHTYKVIIFDRAANRVLRPTVTEAAARTSYQPTRERPFTICPYCRGEGSWMEYEWVQMNSYSDYYARTNRKRRVSCGVCKGWGIDWSKR